jgi:hypothetical protein
VRGVGRGESSPGWFLAGGGALLRSTRMTSEEVELKWVERPKDVVCPHCGEPAVRALMGEVPPLLGGRPTPIVDETLCATPNCPGSLDGLTKV